MSKPVWLDRLALTLLHAESLAEHGGAEGVRDEGVLLSALARPRNLLADEGVSDPARLAAACAVGIARNHPFVDGNKGMGFLAAGLFLALNLWRLAADKVAATRAMRAVASSAMDEAELAAWISQHLVRPEPRRA